MEASTHQSEKKAQSSLISNTEDEEEEEEEEEEAKLHSPDTFSTQCKLSTTNGYGLKGDDDNVDDNGNDGNGKGNYKHSSESDDDSSKGKDDEAKDGGLKDYSDQDTQAIAVSDEGECHNPCEGQ